MATQVAVAYFVFPNPQNTAKPYNHAQGKLTARSPGSKKTPREKQQFRCQHRLLEDAIEFLFFFGIFLFNTRRQLSPFAVANMTVVIFT